MNSVKFVCTKLAPLTFVQVGKQSSLSHTRAFIMYSFYVHSFIQQLVSLQTTASNNQNPRSEEAQRLTTHLKATPAALSPTPSTHFGRNETPTNWPQQGTFHAIERGSMSRSTWTHCLYCEPRNWKRQLNEPEAFANGMNSTCLCFSVLLMNEIFSCRSTFLLPTLRSLGGADHARRFLR